MSDVRQSLDADSLATEQALLSALLVKPDGYLTSSAILRADYFVEPVHRTIYGAIEECRRAGLNGTALDVRRALGACDRDEVVDGETVGSYIAHLAASATTTSANDHAKALRDIYGLRRLTDIAYDGDRSGLPENRLKSAFDNIDALRMEIAESAVSRSTIGEIGLGVLEKSAKIADGQQIEPGVSTGLIDLDRAILGYRPGELVVVAGRPGMGKSVFGTSSALQTSNVQAGGRRGGVGYFALELGIETIGARCLSDLAFDIRQDSPTHSAIRAGQFVNNTDLPTLERATDLLQKRALIVDGRSAATVSEIEAACLAMRRVFERQGRRLDVIFIDYLKQIRATDRYRGNRVYEIGEITHGLRDIAKRLQICVVLIVQLNRSVESREDKRPTMADLRESGDIENDADVVILLYREAYYLQREIKSASEDKIAELMIRLDKTQNELEILISKNRNGAGEQTVRAFCDVGHSAIRSMTRGSYEN